MKKKHTPKADIEEYLTNDFNVKIFTELSENEDLRGEIEPLKFLNLFYEQVEFVEINVSKPLSITKHLRELNVYENEYFYLLSFLIEYFNSADVYLNYDSDWQQLIICRQFIEKEYNKMRIEFFGKEPPQHNESKTLQKSTKGKNNNIKTEKGLIKSIISNINNAFFRLENFMNGRLNEYSYFGFNEAFSNLFILAKKPENYTYENCNLIDDYWNLTEQISYDFEKSDFANTNAYENEMFCKDCKELNILSYDRVEEFVYFTTTDQITENEKKFSITDILKNPPQHFEPKKEQKTPEIKPVFKTEKIQIVFDLLKDFFSIEHQTQLKKILTTGNNTSEHLIFLDSGNRLADAFKQLIKADIITGCEQKELENWIYINFKYRHRKKIKDFTRRYLNDIISTNKDLCRKPILNVTKEKATGKILISKA